MRFIPHHMLLSDDSRTGAYRCAIQRTIKPKDTVVEVGSGSGILSMFAALAGAERVIGFELDPGIAAASRVLIEANGLSDRVQIIAGDARDESLPDKVDVLMSDCVGFFGVAEEMDATIAVRQKLHNDLREMIPRRVNLFLTAAEDMQLAQWLSLPRKDMYRQISLASLAPYVDNTVYLSRLRGAQLLGEPAALGEVDMRHALIRPRRGTARIRITRDGELTALAGLYVNVLGEIDELRNWVDERRPMARNRMFPMSRGYPVNKGDLVEVILSLIPTMSTWWVSVQRGDKLIASEFHSSIMAEPAWPPTLAPAILSLEVIDMIETELLLRHPSHARLAAALETLVGAPVAQAVAYAAMATHESYARGVFTGL